MTLRLRLYVPTACPNLPAGVPRPDVEVEVTKVDEGLEDCRARVRAEYRSCPPGSQYCTCEAYDVEVLVHEDEVSEELLAEKGKRLALKLMNDAPDGVGLLEVVMDFLTDDLGLEPYSTRGCRVRLEDTGGDYPSIRLEAEYYG